jgi:hypothetical protein
LLNHQTIWIERSFCWSAFVVGVVVVVVVHGAHFELVRVFEEGADRRPSAPISAAGHNHSNVSIHSLQIGDWEENRLQSFNTTTNHIFGRSVDLEVDLQTVVVHRWCGVVECLIPVRHACGMAGARSGTKTKFRRGEAKILSTLSSSL